MAILEHRGTSTRGAARALGWAAWPIVAVATAAGLLVPGTRTGQISQLVLVPGLVAVFATFVVRVAVAARTRPARRAGLVALLGGLVLWGLGAASLATAPAHGGVPFPAPAEVWFVGAYAAFAAFLVLDADRDPLGGAVVGTLETVVVCGGAVSLCGMLLPFVPTGRTHGVPTLLALVYPMLDLSLLMLLGSQLLLQRRAPDLRTVRLASAAVVLCAADLGLALGVARGTYELPLLLDLVWCLGFQVLVDAAVSDPSPVSSTGAVRRFADPGVLVAAAVALVACVFQPHGDARLAVVLPAGATLLAAGLRLVFALRAAEGAAQAWRLSRTDDLTGLPNRRAVILHVDALLQARSPLALLIIDLDGFKEVNDSLGHAAGDTTIQAVAGRLRYAAVPRALVARLGGDEFAVVLEQDDEVRLLETAHLVREAVARPVRIEGLDLSLQASVGIAVRLPGDSCADDLLRRADVAMYRAKSTRGGALVYDVERDEYSRDRLRVAADLRRAIDLGQLEVWFQPQVRADDGTVCGAEALVRWRHPQDGLVPPGVFLPVARRAGLMPSLTKVVVHRVVTLVAQWHRDGTGVPVAVNVAPPELLGGVVTEHLYAEADAAGLPAAALVVEVTEDSFLADPGRAREVIEEIHGRGFQVAIDDYGTGFSSLAYLRDLPVQELKIDRSFVSSLGTDGRTELIVTTTTQLAHSLGMRTVAEGVEDAATSDHLRALGVDVLQGYQVAEPMPAERFVHWLAARTAAAGTHGTGPGPAGPDPHADPGPGPDLPAADLPAPALTDLDRPGPDLAQRSAGRAGST